MHLSYYFVLHFICETLSFTNLQSQGEISDFIWVVERSEICKTFFGNVQKYFHL